MKHTTKRFYFSTQRGNLIHDDLPVATALPVIRELARQGFRFVYALWI